MKRRVHTGIHFYTVFAAISYILSYSSRGEEPISFRNDVMAILSKAGCNAGQCHGNANGKAGFKLSLRGENADLDFLALTHDQFNRRVDLVEPEQSLILLKPTTQLAHEGGQRFKTNSWEYLALLRWLKDGATNDFAFARSLVQLEATPSEATLFSPTNDLQITAVAFYSDGSKRDVTSLAVYESANPNVKINTDGRVHSGTPGETTVLVRYLNEQRPVRLAFVPQRPGFVWSKPPANNYIDYEVFAKLERLRTNPSELCSDETFVRRAYLDLLGIVPRGEEARSFVLNGSETKRSRLIDDLLEREEFADFWALKWLDLLRAEERILDRKGLELFHEWVRHSLLEHKPLDQFAREIIAARGSTYKNPPANFYRATRTPMERAEATAQLFLGIRVQCAQCHNHPFDRWSQDDYYDWQRVFAGVQYKVLENRRRDDNDGHEFKGEQIVYLAKAGEVKNPRSGAAAKPRFLGEKEYWSDNTSDELAALARWVAHPNNPFFAKVQANRVWFHLFGRGLVDPIDDFRASNPSSHPALLEALAADFVNHGFDLRQLIRVIMNSRTYQLAAFPNETNEADEINFSHSVPRRLGAEQLLDCQGQVLGMPPHLIGYPAGTRAVQLAGALAERKRDQGKSEADQFLAMFGKPARLLPSECERSCEPTMGQAFQMMNGPLLNEMLSAPANVLGKLCAGDVSNTDSLKALYWATLSRAPRSGELSTFETYLVKAKDRRAAFEDIAWSLLNSKEFLFR
ncbi:MAG TPA: DUF1549 and DUF1553 domain-containing protein [Verrucomicrobiae bacterium]|nr:DUF1549 and DUF1553 domain-containing protein [Verrucomicrobiae bacterium]